VQLNIQLPSHSLAGAPAKSHDDEASRQKNNHHHLLSLHQHQQTKTTIIHPDRQAARLAAANARIDARQRGQEAINRMAESMTGVPIKDLAATAASFSAASNTVLNYQNQAAVVDAFQAAMAPDIRRSGRQRYHRDELLTLAHV
jgi:hypothetical protein